METYTCKNCKEDWNFYPEDYEDLKNYEDIECPFCSMPVTQMIHDIYKEEGVWLVIKQLWKRYF